MASLRRRSPLRLCDLGSPGHALSSQIGLEPRRPFGSTPTTHCDYDVGMGRRSRLGDTALGAPFTTGLTSTTGPTSSPGLHDSAPYDTSPVRLHRTSPARTFVSGPASSARGLRDGPSPARPGPPSGLSETPPLKVARSSTGGYPSTPPMLPAAESGPVAEEGGSTLEVWALRGSLTQSERRRGLLADSLREACGALAEQASRLQRRQAELTDSRATVEELTVRQKYLESSIAALEKERKQLGAGAGTHQRGLQERVRRLEEQISDARSSLDEVATETRRRRSLERVRLDAQALGRARTGPWPGASPSRCSVGPLLSVSGAVTPLGCPHGCASAGVASPPHLASPAHLANGLASGRLAEDAWVRRTLMTQLDELKAERQTSAREKEQLSSRVRALEEASAGLQTRVGAAEGDRDRLKQERDELSKRAETLAHDAESGARQKSGLEAELAEKAAELARVKGRAERVEEERARAVEELRALQTVRERQSAEVSDLRQKLETERERLLRHEAEGRLAGARAGALQGERDRLLAEKELAERERRQLQGQLDALRDAHESTRHVSYPLTPSPPHPPLLAPP
uniref:Coiled-coil domain-containing protein 102A-like n=1 Tax=Petromyzon marinus TaxID=7757 RepID=A0AAJ7WUV7_PETMA|nr:coiled-coil domain-containing protein 102A-like [Petromyzon marinus]